LRSGVILVQGSQVLGPSIKNQFKARGSQCSLSPKRTLATTTSRCKVGPSKKVGGGTIRENLRKKYRNILVKREDLNKRPSDLEIAKKELPENTPTLGERLDRDVYNMFHVQDEKQGYRSHRKPGMSLQQEVKQQIEHDIKTRPWQAFKENFQVVREEIKKFDKEVRDTVKAPHANIADWYPHPGERKNEWSFSGEDDLKQWVLTADSDWGEGYSAAQFETHPLGHCVLKGELSTRVPADGRIQNAGYVNISSVPKTSAFAQEKLMDHWVEYTHLTMNIRGDGRKYMINLKVKRDFDILWNDRWHYPLYTRGGPYWQYVKIPWSKFFLGSRGRIQDRQSLIPLEAGVVGMSISLMDGNTGPFHFEIKDIGLHNDPTADDEEFAYEMYKLPDFWAGF